MHSGDITCCPLELTGTPKQIVGYGKSPYVEYEGTGLYFINVSDESVEVELLPHSRFLRNIWEWYTDAEPYVELDSSTALPFELKLPGFRSISFKKKPGRYDFPLIAETISADNAPTSLK